MNLLKVEALSDLISSETELQRKQAINLMSGDVSKKYEELRNRLLKILANVEAKIDFPDEDLPEDILKNVKNETENIIKIINSILNDNKVEKKIQMDLKLLLLANKCRQIKFIKLFIKREVAIVSEIEGTTRTIEVNLNLDDIRTHF